MSRKAFGFIIALFMLCAVHAVAGQELNNRIASPATVPVITGAASAARLRFTAPSSVVQMQLQIYAESGQLLFDVTSKGNVLDWTVQDSGGEHLVPGSYLCVVTVKSLSGKLTQRIGSALVQEKQVGLRAEPTQLTLAQQQAVGPIEENGALTILNAEETQATTVLANNGTEGQMIRGRGALSFRIGNFFSGIDTEQMRLTEEGNLGIGTSQPQAKLEVAGAIRAERFLLVKPKATDRNTSQASDSVQVTDSSDSVQPLTSGSGTQNRIAKWTDNAGTLGDSVMTENNGNIGLGTTTPGARFHVVGVQGLFGAGTFQLDAATPFSSWASAFPAFEVLNTNLTNNNVSLFQFSDTPSGTAHAGIGAVSTNHASKFGDLFFFTKGADGYQLRMGVYGGNVGIGTTTPASKLEVNGGYLTVGSSATNKINVDADATGAYLQSSGTSPLRFYSGATEAVRVLNSGNVGIGTTAPGAKLDVNGNINTSTQYNIGGYRMFAVNGVEEDLEYSNTMAGFFTGTATNEFNFANSYFGWLAGQNATGNLNSFFGASAGSSNTTGSNNTLMGAYADVGANNLTNATAIGAYAKVTQSNSLVLGSINGLFSADTNVGIGTTAPLNILHLSGNRSNFALTFTNQANTAGKRGYRIAFDNDRLTFQQADDSGNFAANHMAIDPASGNVGIGTTAPHAKLQVAGGNIYVTNPNGVIISSPNGTCWQIGVSNAGALTTIPTPCP